MKVVGLVTEYNPFHNGHKYHIEEAKKVTGADYVIAVMSGNFVQRGTPAIMDKYTRAEMALHNGVDLVFELPVCYATASAEYFALGAVSLLDKLGIVDEICFGSECGDIKLIKEIAYILVNAPKEYDELLSSYMKEGFTFPAAREKAFAQYLQSNNALSGISTERLTNVLSEPNNILGIEYVKALLSLSSTIRPVTIQRKVAGYHDRELYSRDNQSECSNTPSAISSATAIRNIFMNINDANELSPIADSVPANVYNNLITNYHKTYPITEDAFASIIRYKLLFEGHGSLSSYLDITKDLADRMKNISNPDYTMEELVQHLKTKNFTLTRINRALLHMLLNIRKGTFDSYNKKGFTPYARILGIKKESSHLLRTIADIGRIPIIRKVSQASKQLDPLAMQMLSEDILATHLYNQAVYERYGTSLRNEYRRGIVII
ncbi:MAG: nucleotidyltransferase [Clostridiales bacterium]|nr:nucleotidyltransferase [Clostridiales bacterium]